ncbi:nuclear transport factor 2 family protein [Sphingomonas sabuli]|uniref:Nuclear transport factor 2 family protein n=1 Tax=Sphingomonas sabuli TaxID=2764186 RepID=A0A7G9L408_9SPHN|nr:nuclear transport factor 2 family protein [Sphingomonas sabuli]QNM83357.1 nuclear transport factor 2 family protein [Sphingomonas sabuli]
MKWPITIAAASLALLPATALAAPARNADTAAVIKVLGDYKAAIERLDGRGTERLFTPDSMIFETGGAEGNYANYLRHHLGPELKEFRSFKFSNYKVDVRFVGGAAVATETYGYRIETIKGEVAERLGVATSVLRKEKGRWRIVMMHNSARRPKPS